MKVEDYERSMGQAEYACFAELVDILGLQSGVTASIGSPLGKPDSMTWKIAELATGATTTFPAPAHHFFGRLDLFNRDRAMLQRWIMRLMMAFPANHAYNRDNAVRKAANVVHFRISPERGAVGDIRATTVEASNTGPVPTWMATVLFDVVFVTDPAGV